MGDKLKARDRKTKKLMALNGVFQNWADVDRLYVTCGKRGRGRLPVEEVVRAKKHKMSDYLKRSKVI